VEDVVLAVWLALTEEKAVGEVFNVASGKVITINCVVEILRKISGKEGLESVHERSREGDIRRSYVGIDEARLLLGYELRFSLDEGLRELVQSVVGVLVVLVCFELLI
jgi:nucleoside-diphosphate-sugar epimerase